LGYRQNVRYGYAENFRDLFERQQAAILGTEAKAEKLLAGFFELRRVFSQQGKAVNGLHSVK
jgi:hypothetical protein